MKKSILIKTVIIFGVLIAVVITTIALYPADQNVADSYTYVPEETPTTAQPPTQTSSMETTATPAETKIITEERYVFEEDLWSYESPELIVEIEKKMLYDCDVFVAHIYLSDMMQMFSGFAKDRLPPIGTQTIEEISNIYKSVLAISGDYFIKSENKYHSPIIKNGKVIREKISSNILAQLPTKLMIFRKFEQISTEMLIERKVENTFGFGPVLVLEGEIYPDVYTHKLKRPYPRCGIGEIEPGHLLVILVDETNETDGVTLAQFAKIFKDNGATLAFNLDAGKTPSMVFMGVPINIDTKKEYDYQRETSDVICFGTSEKSPDMKQFDELFDE